jgi:F-type H+-transporting ATPase subunit gamma
MKSARPFMHRIQLLLGRLAQSGTAQENKLFAKPASGVPLYVIFTSDRGLCGAFNANLLKILSRELKADPTAMVFVIGKKGREYVRRHFPTRIAGEIADLNGSLEGKTTDRISNELLDGFLNGKYSRIELVYPEYVSMVLNRPTVSRYLPMEASAFGVPAEEADKAIDYLLEPSPERVFEVLLPRYLRSKIYLVLAETFTSEHSARMMAMNSATKNCDELTDTLTLRLNKARQSAITTEIIEIVSGANALQA